MSEMKLPRVRLVMFMVCLSIAGAFVAGVHYLAIDLPQQNIQPPLNSGSGLSTASCVDQCFQLYLARCVWYEKVACGIQYHVCNAKCQMP